jgi:large subunit ribosomal protein L21
MKILKNNIIIINIIQKIINILIMNENLYAIAQISGKQIFLVRERWYDIDLIKTSNLEDFIFFSKILLFQKLQKIQLGKPFLENIKIPAKILQVLKGKKIIVLKTRPKKKYMRKKGHRQLYTRIKID